MENKTNRFMLDVPESLIDGITQRVTELSFKKAMDAVRNTLSELALRDMVSDEVRRALESELELVFRPRNAAAPEKQTVSAPAEQPAAVEEKTAPKAEKKEEPKAEEASATAQTTDNMPFDADAVRKAITDAISVINSTDDLADANALLQKEIHKLTSGKVKVTIRKAMRGDKFLPSFINTPEMSENHRSRGFWNGIVSIDNIIPELEKAFKGVMISAEPQAEDADSERDSDTPLTAHRRILRKQKGYQQGTYTKVRPGSRIMRMRCSKNSDKLSPMVIDPEFAKEMMDDGFTHVKIMRGTKTGEICLIFSKEVIPTRAPAKARFISRLHVFGRNSSKSKEPTTYSISSCGFQETILNHYNTTCTGLQERVFGFEVTRKDDKQCIIRLNHQQ